MNNNKGLDQYIKVDEIISKVHDNIDAIDHILQPLLNEKDVNACIGALAIMAKELVMEPITEIAKSVKDEKLLKIMTEFAGEVSNEVIALLRSPSSTTLDDVRICRTHLYNASENYSLKTREIAMEKYNPGTLEKLKNMSTAEIMVNEDMFKMTLLQATIDLVNTKPDYITNANWHIILEGTVETFNRSAGSEAVPVEWINSVADKLNRLKTVDEVKLLLNRLINDLQNEGKVRTFEDVARMEAVVNSIKRILDTEKDYEERRSLVIAMIQVAIEKKFTTLDVINNICRVCDPIRERNPYEIEQIKRELDDIVVQFKPTEKEMVKFTHLDKIKNGEVTIVIKTD